MSNYTPGPWRVRPLNHGADVEKIEGDGSATLVAAVYGGDEHWQANANLIEVAPDLLEALKRVRDAFYVKGTSKALRAAFEGTKELVVKAEGRDQ